ncbi:hypothetical protein EG68_07959 [Paragonimus skrjabini miyazakii]|uniref:Meckel syndrome type 1 protein n=1 Tax=Paragonimus skrjabini miyazakii TaxID=59628 RepID=A0A8S9YKQ9_9TREM|nr:hypothetical protein EG68_07959 [Paragonimus skrjabini miyazakii]
MKRVKNVGTYPIRDPLKNLKIRVKLGRPVASTVAYEDIKKFDEELVVSWQQKYFSPREKIIYRQEQQSYTDLQRSYHKQATMTKEISTNNRLFTYVEGDEFCVQLQSPVEGGEKCCSYPSRLVSRNDMEIVSQNAKSQTCGKKHFNIVMECPTKAHMFAQHLPGKPTQVMYIMADLSDDVMELKNGDIAPIRDEVVLCTISYDPHGILTVAPDFFSGKEYFKVESNETKNWRAYNQKLLCGSTQVSIHHSFQDREVSLFSHPIEFDLAYKSGLDKEIEQPLSMRWPILYLEVISFDFWSRSRTEGYGYVELPRTYAKKKGQHGKQVDWSKMQERTRRLLDRMSLSSKHLVKYGFRTQSSGTVTLRFNCVVQSWSNMHKQMRTRMDQTSENERKHVFAHLDIATVIKAYQRARTRLLETRQIVESIGKMKLN